ncbi:hypothetical protein NE865_02055 [Phthorimaea operculella]|nr:hypothetical protein NE865_02055 [Phthorimaea operculella]
MNEQGTKKILFNKSTLLSLKAELLKKQEEVKGKKHLPQHNLQSFKPPPAKPSEKVPKGGIHTKKTFKDSLQAVDTEEIEAYKKTKAALEKKAELYEHLSNPVGDSELSSRYLVDFGSKKQQAIEDPPPDKIDAPDDTSCDVDDDDDSDWTEYTDCLGRTRKCLKSDLALFKEKDQQLMKGITKESNPVPLEHPREIEEKKHVEKPLLVQKTNDYLQSLREKWEQKERELLAKDKDIHYQDLLFDEARMHGVGYFAFSTDEKVRREQMEELLARREETLRAQAAAEAARRQQEDLLAARLRAARARQRLRAGLPPDDPEENQKDFNACLLEFLNKQKAEAEARAKEEEKKIKEQIEKERQKLREAYVRDWDRGKEGVEERVKKFQEMTQEEYVEQQRAKRIGEFAPIQSTSGHTSKYVFDDKGQKVSEEGAATKTWSDVRPKVKTPPPPDISDFIAAQEEQKGLYFSSKKPQSMKYRNFVKVQEPVPIQNELSDDEESDGGERKPAKRKYNANHVEVPPPPTFEYYGPVNKKTKPKNPFESDLREAFAQGAKSLETKPSNRKLLKEYDFSLE